MNIRDMTDKELTQELSKLEELKNEIMRREMLATIKENHADFPKLLSLGETLVVEKEEAVSIDAYTKDFLRFYFEKNCALKFTWEFLGISGGIREAYKLTMQIDGKEFVLQTFDVPDEDIDQVIYLPAWKAAAEALDIADLSALQFARFLETIICMSRPHLYGEGYITYVTDWNEGIFRDDYTYCGPEHTNHVL
ncbi:MAG: hypothetical protein Tsb0021_02590 [Chlamydiales bacterium]